MKNVIINTKKGFLMVTMFATLLSFANEPSFFNVKNDINRTLLSFDNAKEGNLLSIKDVNGIILYKEFIQKAGIYTKGFDLTSLPDGSYFFELDDDVEIKTIPFTVTESSVVFNKDKEITSFKPVTRLKGDLVYITKLALNKEPLKIDVYFKSSESSEGYEKVYSEKVKDEVKIERLYKLSGLEKGDYKLVFNTEGKVFTKYFNK